ncbi:MAG TPA: hypothetical protein VIT91_09030 [Chthoniobacterales bacterium]
MSEKKKVTIAVIGSLLLHVLFFFGFGTWLSVRPQASAKVPERDLPPEITLIAEPTPTPDPRLGAAPTPTPEPELLRSENMTEAEKPPENTSFESDRDTLAASEKAGTGPKNMPAIEGRKQDHLELADQQLSLGSAGAGAAQGRPSQNQPAQQQQQNQARQEPAKTATDLAKLDNPLLKPSTALPTPTPPPDKLPDDALAIERATPTPTPTPTPTATPSPTASPSPAGGGAPAKPSSSAGGTFRPQTQASELQGSISNHGRPSIATRGTPLGRYFNQVYRAIGSRWYYYVRRDADLIGPGRVQVIFNISKDGKIDNVRVLSNTANEGLASICIQSIVDSELPPIPDEVALTLPTGRLEMPFSFTFHP